MSKWLKITDVSQSYPGLAVVPAYDDVKTSGTIRIQFKARFENLQGSLGVYVGRDNPFEYTNRLLFIGWSGGQTNPYPNNIVVIVYDDSGNATFYDTGIVASGDVELDVIIDIDNGTITVNNNNVGSLAGTKSAGAIVLATGNTPSTGAVAYFDYVTVYYNDEQLFSEDFENGQTTITPYENSCELEIVELVNIIEFSGTKYDVTQDDSNIAFAQSVDLGNRIILFITDRNVANHAIRVYESSDGISLDNLITTLDGYSVPAPIRVGDYIYLFALKRTAGDVMAVLRSRIDDLTNWEEIATYDDPDFPEEEAWGLIYDVNANRIYVYYDSISEIDGVRRLRYIEFDLNSNTFDTNTRRDILDTSMDAYCVYVYKGVDGYWYMFVMRGDPNTLDHHKLYIYRGDDRFFTNSELLVVLDFEEWHGGVDTDTPSLLWRLGIMYIAAQHSTWSQKATKISDLRNYVDLPDPDTSNYIPVGYGYSQPHFDITAHTGTVTASPGEQVNLWVTISNDGNASGVARVELYDNDNNLVNSQEVTLDPGASQTVQFTITAPSQPGTYTYTWKVYNEATSTYDDTAQDTVTVQANPHFTITSYTGSVTVQAGQQFTVQATVENDGGQAGMVMVRLRDSQGNVVASQELDLDPGASQTATLTATAPSQSGTYTYTLEAYNEATSTVDDSKQVTVTVTQPPPPPPKKKGGFPWWIILVILGAVVLGRKKK